MILTIEVMLTVVVPLVLGGILDQGDACRSDRELVDERGAPCRGRLHIPGDEKTGGAVPGAPPDRHP